MDKGQAKILEANGFALGRVPDLTPQPRAKFYSRDKNTGKVVEHNLPADAYSLNHYLKRGLVLNPTDLPPQAGVENICPTCGVNFTTRIALEGHKRSHKKITEGGN